MRDSQHFNCRIFSSALTHATSKPIAKKIIRNPTERRLLKTRGLPPLVQNANQSFVAATGVVGRADKWLVDNRDVAKTITSDLAKTTMQVRKTLETTEKTMLAVKATVADERTLYQLQTTLREVGEAARSLRQLGDYLERHPDAIIRGRKEGG
jgi:paraquat-inducible protein B